MSLLSEILNYNQIFIDEKLHEKYSATKFPNKKLVILTCIDTRLVELLHKAMNMKNGDVKVVKTFGAVLRNPFGSIMRSILISVYELKAEEVFVVGNYDYGMSNIESQQILEKMMARGVSEKTLEIIQNSGIKLDQWLEGFDNVETSIAHSVNIIRNHPLMDKSVPVHGLVIDPNTGKLSVVVNGYKPRGLKGIA